MSDSDSIVDLLVFGGGMAGMSAAARACSDGASVILVEKGPAIGGSAMYAGFIWTAPTRRGDARGQPGRGSRAVGASRRALRRGARLGPVARRSRRRAGDRARIRAWIPDRYGQLPAGLRAAGARTRRTARGVVGAATAVRGRSRGRRRDRERIRRAARDPRALDAARHRWLRGRSRAARRAHPPAGRRPAAARESEQRRRRPAARPVGGRRVRTARTPASTAT